MPVAWETPSPAGYGQVQGQLGGFKVSRSFEDSQSAERSLGASCHGQSLPRGGAVSLPVRGLPPRDPHSDWFPLRTGSAAPCSLNESNPHLQDVAQIVSGCQRVCSSVSPGVPSPGAGVSRRNWKFQAKQSVSSNMVVR